MTIPLTDEQLEAIKVRADKATPGPWHRVGPPWNNDVPFVVAGNEDPHVGRFICDLDLIFSDDEPDESRDQVADGEFIAHARADIPALLAEVERLKTEANQLRAIRTMRAMWEKLGVHGMPVEKEIFAQCARDLGSILDRTDAAVMPTGRTGDHEGNR